MENNNKNSFNGISIGSVSFDEKTVKTKLNLWLSVFTQPMQVIEEIAQNTQVDLMQIILITIAATVFGFITGGIAGFTSIIGTPIAIALGGVFLLIVSLIARGSTDYIKLINFSAYLVLITSLAGLAVRIPIVSFGVGFVASIYCVYLQYIGMPHITGSKKEIIKIICIVQLVIIGLGVIGGILGFLGFLLVSGTSMLGL